MSLVLGDPLAPLTDAATTHLFPGPLGSEPIRGELFGPEHLEAHARQLAAASAVVAVGPRGQPLLDRFRENGRFLVRAHRLITEAYRQRESIGTDAEWLLDNFHIVADAVREVHDDLPRGYYTELAKLARGPLAGYPRVYALALSLLAHTDSVLDENNITRFVQAYQTAAPLAIGELWAVPIMLRLGLLENLRRLADHMLQTWNARRRAEREVPRLAAWQLGLAAHPLAALLHPETLLPDPFIVHLLQALRGLGPAAASAVEWLEAHCQQCRTTTTEVLRREHQRQAANQVSVGNCVTSLRLLSALDWTIFFDQTSLVEAILRDDPAGVYGRQDFATKDRYRRTVERLARGAHLNELEAARRAVALARSEETRRQGDRETRRQGDREGGDAAPASAPPPAGLLVAPQAQNHVGYYLVGAGLRTLEAALQYRPRFRERWLRTVLDHPGAVYFGALAVVTLAVVAGMVVYGLTASAGWGLLVLLGAAVLLPASELAVGLVNYLVTLIVPPRVLPKLDFKEGMTSDCCTFVVMPALLVRPESAAVLLERLEVHYLSNPDPHLYFALLTDFADAPAEHMPEDESYVQAALDRVRELNQRYSRGGPDRFFVLHRRRQWNPVQQCWMGWERKRGKLMEFNRLLRGARDTSFAVQSGDLGGLPFIRYVITLDADTQLPRETARRLVGTLAHPLNRAVFDPRQGRVVHGYGILQPRVSLRLHATASSLFARVFAGSAGIDPYAVAVSDVYQDLFGLGSFTGKGLYDVDAFEAALGNTFPENHILSHDLIEGNFARCGLVSDIELLDDFPQRYHVYARREHRWARGDWQIVPWLFPRVPYRTAGAAGKGTRPNALPAVERWKIADNLRRSLVPPALLVLLVLGWLVLPGAALAWTGLALAVLALPLLLQVVGGVLNMVRNGAVMGPLRELAGDLGPTAGQVLLATVFLADQALTLVDAVGRTLFRLAVSRQRLLEWETAASTERRLGPSLTAFFLSMWPASALALALGGLVGLLRPEVLPVALPLLAAWLVSPLVAFWVSRPARPVEAPVSAEDRRALRRVARKTWHFFETFVGDTDHWLPPDNYQEDPKGELAHRTSPTNQGLLLLSTLAAHDLGYVSLPTLVERLEKTFATFDRLERFQGHFYNWYDTRTLHPLQPGYISTVDSGNLLGCLLVLKHGLREVVEEPVPGPAFREGLADTLGLALEAVRALLLPVDRPAKADLNTITTEDGGERPAPERLLATLQAFEAWLAALPSDWLGWKSWLDQADRAAQDLLGQLPALASSIKEEPDEVERWVTRLAEQIRGQGDQLAALAPWLEVLTTQRASLAVADDVPADVQERWRALERTLIVPAGPAELVDQAEGVLAELAELGRLWPGAEGQRFFAALAAAVRRSNAGDLLARCQLLADRAGLFGAEMDFRFLYNGHRNLFSTGYNLGEGRLDNSHYDLLASEARLASFLAVARGEADRKHWFALGRPVTRAGRWMVLLSWGGTLFEYLMPQIFLRSYPGTLLDETCRGVVGRQIDYGRQCRTPWGISESAFGALDAALDYQYQSFGVPGLGLKRGLAQDLVIAPYATALAVPLSPRDALANFRRLAAEGGEGTYGFYEAVDYTPERLLKRKRSLVVKSYMAHHQGMGLLALANYLLDFPIVRRFHAEPMVRATELLLQERMLRSAPLVTPNTDEVLPTAPVLEEGYRPMTRHLTTANTPAPRTHLLSCGQYSVMVTNAGAGYSTCRGLDVTRWREDRTRDAWGQFCYVRDLRSGLLWSAGHQPVGRIADEYHVYFSADRVEIRRSDAGIETHLEITVSPEKCAEVRRVTLTNHNPRPHDLEVTSYAELVLAPHGADLAHPAFGKLFLETEFVPGPGALLCRRRPRAEHEKPIWAVHVLAVDGPTVGRMQYETDRAVFLGRGRTPANPAALEPRAGLSGRTGPVLDPIFSLRQRVRVATGASVSVAFTTAVADTRDEALTLADQYSDPHAVARAFELALAHSQVEVRHLRLTAEETHLYQRLASAVLYAGSVLRASPTVLAANHQGQPGLWRHGISGDKPTVLVRVAETEELTLVRQVLAGHTYWRLRGLEADLVILNEHPTSYFEDFHQQLLALVRGSDAHALLDKPGGVFVRKAAHISEEDRLLLQAAARVVLKGDRGSLASQVDRTERAPALPPRLVAARKRSDAARARGSPAAAAAPLQFANGWGGFSADGREYVIHFTGAAEAAPRWTPAPWINVVANPVCGFLISESGAGYTWVGNSQGNRLTPWSNDPVSDPPGEALYLRDEETGDFWSPTLLPVGTPEGKAPREESKPGAPAAAPQPWSCRHGQGYTVFERQAFGLAQEVVLLVPPDDPVKLICVRVRNLGKKARRLSATFYAEWVLGTVRDQAAMNVLTELDPDSGALLAHNPFNTDFGAAVAFADVSLRPRTVTADRTEFLGRNGSLTAPAALGRVELSNRVGAALDPCAALQAPFDVPAGETREVVFLLGEAASRDAARQLLARYRQPDQVQAALDAVRARWEAVLGAVQVHTPNPALDVLLNRWLLYQVLSCRLWARSAFYQSGGAYGFRDQLQDVAALVYGAPQEARAHILRAAGRQFLEGDVQHWWHPPAGRGVRTRFSDDFLWLPFVVCHYVTTTGDAAILDEPVHYLTAPLLPPDREEDYGLPETTEQTGTLYEHCVRALDHGYRLGVHGLPLMGTGDWNDGMNRVGAGGKGESVWDGWFQLTILHRFAELVEARGDADRAQKCRDHAEQLRQAIEEHAWDGRWYKRAWFDDGTPLGSAENDECRIDSIAQSWAVISGAARPERARQAMEAVDELLVRDADQQILLFTPPFDAGKLHPGYIKGYVPGIRENGGQYTHAATWVVEAMALLGRGGRAVELFDLLNPVRHTATPPEVDRYRVEPYVVVADIYGAPPHTGRGGWTWYTGSAGWLYRVALEAILGFRLHGRRLRMEPCIARAWPGYEITYRYRSATYHIRVENPQSVERGVARVEVDGRPTDADGIDLVDDGGRHEVRVILGGEASG